VIHYWFKLAASLLGIVLLIAAGLTWKSMADVQATAATTARDAAKAKVEEVLKQPELQALVQKTASDLYEKGAFRSAIEAKVRQLISEEITTAESRKLIGDAIKRELVTRTAPRILTESQRTTIADSLRASPDGQVVVRPGAAGEQQSHGRKLYLAIKAAPSWANHVSYASSVSLAGLTDAGDETMESLGGTGGIVIVVNDIRRPPDSARQLEAALKGAGVADVRLGACGCASPPKSADIWVYVLEKSY
jgi:hypothetical protein